MNAIHNTHHDYLSAIKTLPSSSVDHKNETHYQHKTSQDNKSVVKAKSETLKNKKTKHPIPITSLTKNETFLETQSVIHHSLPKIKTKFIKTSNKNVHNKNKEFYHQDEKFLFIKESKPWPKVTKLQGVIGFESQTSEDIYDNNKKLLIVENEIDNKKSKKQSHEQDQKHENLNHLTEKCNNRLYEKAGKYKKQPVKYPDIDTSEKGLITDTQNQKTEDHSSDFKLGPEVQTGNLSHFPQNKNYLHEKQVKHQSKTQLQVVDTISQNIEINHSLAKIENFNNFNSAPAQQTQEKLRSVWSKTLS